MHVRSFIQAQIKSRKLKLLGCGIISQEISFFKVLFFMETIMQLKYE